MKTEEDKVVTEIPVYLSHSILDQLYVFQYPCQPLNENFDEANVTKARVKPIADQVELDISLCTRTPTYDYSKGEQISLNVDGPSRDKTEESVFSSNVMDKIVYRSSKSAADASNYCVGVMRDSALHIAPIKSILSLKPSFDFLDISEKRGKADLKDVSEDSDEEEAKKVRVRFERPETERSKMMKERTFGFLQKKIREEPWMHVDYHGFGSERSEFEMSHHFCSNNTEDVTSFNIEPSSYVQMLIPPVDDSVAGVTQALPPHLLSMAALKSLPLEQRVRAIMENVGVASFNELVCSVASGERDETDTVLKIVQQIAQLVQGNWVVQSDVLFPKEKGSSSSSGLPNELLQKARDTVLYLFLDRSSINRSDVTKLIDVPEQDLTDILKGVALPKGSRGVWQFLLPQDTIFSKRYPDVHERQQKIWKSRYEQLSQHFKLENKNTS